MKFLSKDPTGYDAHPEPAHPRSPQARGRESYDELNAFLGQGCTYEGKLTFEGAVRIDGRFSGEIFSDGTLIIGEGADIQAQINVNVVIVSGRVQGDVHAADRLELRKPARLTGNIFSPTLVVEEGVFFEGQCRMRSTVTEERRRPEAEREVDLEPLPNSGYGTVA